MQIKNTYSPRSIRFLRVVQCQQWQVKLYSICMHPSVVEDAIIDEALQQLDKWLGRSNDYDLDTYNIATFIIHEGREGCFAILQWWIDENMLQSFVYLKRKGETSFQLYSQNGMASCVWEMAIWWHERNAWVRHVLAKNEQPDVAAYLEDILNTEI